jgi:hypothetical protein
MEYMESKMQDQNDAFEDQVESLESFITELVFLAREHNISNSDLNFVNRLFQINYMPELNNKR